MLACPAEALRANRLHNQILPNVSVVERSSTHQGITVDGLSETQVAGLEDKGHKLEWDEGAFLEEDPTGARSDTRSCSFTHCRCGYQVFARPHMGACGRAKEGGLRRERVVSLACNIWPSDSTVGSEI